MERGVSPCHYRENQLFSFDYMNLQYWRASGFKLQACHTTRAFKCGRAALEQKLQLILREQTYNGPRDKHFQ